MLVASIDQVSGGWFRFGTGGGCNAEEIGVHGAGFATRMKKMRGSARVRDCPASSSKTSMDLRQAAACDGLISPRYGTVALHNAAGPEAMVLDDAPIAVRLAILLSPDLLQKDDAANLARGIRR
jgi:hypothetical protein